MDFETYLISKKIDSVAFHEAEPGMWKVWRNEFEQMHPDSFTMQKLNLINPIRRKYPLTTVVPKPEATSPASSTEVTDTKPTSPEQPLAQAKPVIPKPVFKPKPKMS